MEDALLGHSAVPSIPLFSSGKLVMVGIAYYFIERVSLFIFISFSFEEILNEM